MLFTRRYDEAIQLANRAIELEPNAAFALAFQGVAYAQQGRLGEAVANMRKAAQIDGNPSIRSLQAHVLALAGHKAEALALVRQIEDETRRRYVCPYEIGTVYESWRPRRRQSLVP